ncbi:Holliday junction resolvase [Emticicia oligotrophica DSM 17448]|jgi:putative Holliday junction resolvase|uniref:Putative pre-16S rRNA nuclease n=1 Tax=Emticicia oligotrophica (strain DSM 17448 / CIP 109782 / MTCC 6937 / GPTSA100-15) TaxID=929562 RepID=A0ABM5N0G8_EMTOG|nr:MULTISPECIES: Holliday junction resolvase RuvX [Emticicia]AFK02797.1 Holliday junction resolvase [Emticicia oligotrophica DSM 17448]
MPRILAIDYGAKRTGLAVTDPSKIIASALETVPTDSLLDYLKKYTQNEAVEAFVVGMPKNLDGSSTDGTAYVERFVLELKNIFPEIPIHLHDERFTSKMAMQTMIAGGMKKKDRQVKGNIDKISAVIILQSFMGV